MPHQLSRALVKAGLVIGFKLARGFLEFIELGFWFVHPAANLYVSFD